MKTPRAIVKFDRIGFHRWDNAGARRLYLASLHRHRFYFTVTIDVFHDDREIEFHDLLATCKKFAPKDNGNWGEMSCEMIAEELAMDVQHHYGNDRTVTVSCFEDNEVGAEVTLPAQE